MSETIKSRFEISEDELMHREELQKKYRTDPVRKAVQVLEAALDLVLSRLGVNVNDYETIPQQQEDLGIIITENDDPRTPQINGFFVFLQKISAKDASFDYIPYAWVGAAFLGSDGKCRCDIQWFQEEKLTEMSGVKIK